MREWNKRDERAGYEHRDKTTKKQPPSRMPGLPSLKQTARDGPNYRATNR